MHTLFTALLLGLAMLLHATPASAAGDCCRDAHSCSDTSTRTALESVDAQSLAFESSGASESVAEDRGNCGSDCCGDDCGGDDDCDCDDCHCSDLVPNGARALCADEGESLAIDPRAQPTRSLPACELRCHGPPRLEAPPGRRRMGLLCDARIIPQRD